MALSILDNTFDAQWIQDQIGPLAIEAYLQSSLLGYGALMVPTVTGRYGFGTLDLDAELAPLGVCNTDADYGNIDITQRRENTCAVQLALQADHDSFVNSYFAEGYRSGTLAKRLTDVQVSTLAITQSLLERFFERVENYLMNGAGYDAGLQVTCPDEGLLPKLALNVPAANAVSTPVAITKANVLEQMKRLYDTLPIAVRNRKGRFEPVFALSSNIYEAAMDRYYNPTTVSGTGPSGTIAGVNWESGEPTRIVSNKRFYQMEHLPDNTAFITWPQNIVQAIDTRADMTQLVITDLFPTLQCRRVRMLIAANVGVAVQRYDQVATYNIN